MKSACWRGGQSMMLSVFAIGATLLGAATIAGLLMFYQIRQATDLSNSNQAIYAADSGVEWGLYQFFQVASSTATPTPVPVFGNGAAVTVYCYDVNANGALTSSVHPSDSDPCADALTTTIVAQGIDSTGGAQRTLRFDILAVQFGG